ncbi:MAG: class I SAM-dependent methyltransferase [Planctomycetales bacterium]|nr:class I SAM-dependent methyltransferase [Planctomycetales bacterium]
MILIAFISGFALALACCLPVLNRWSIKYRSRPLWGRSYIPTATLEEVDPIFISNDLGVSHEAEATLIGGTAVGGTSTLEGWILAALAKRSLRMFEFGTCTGRTTYAWAVNSPEDAAITTLTLREDDRGDYQPAAGDKAQDTKHALQESRFQSFYYSDSAVEYKVEQLFGDSKQLDITPWRESCDLIFIDGSHAYSYVVNDTDKALQMVRPGGLVLWHDYRGKQVPGVYRAINDLAQRLPLRRIPGTSLVMYRKPAVESSTSDNVKHAA